LSDKYEVESRDGRYWVTAGDGLHAATFYGTTAFQDARNYAAELNSRVPKIELPSELGLYQSIEHEDIVRLHGDGSWQWIDGGDLDAETALAYAPFTRLYTESEVRELRAQAVESVPSDWSDEFKSRLTRGVDGAPPLGKFCDQRAAEIRAEAPHE
jgi:hypothetical protein